MSTTDAVNQSLKHYFRLAVEANGLQWSYENDNEIDAIVELIIETAAQEGANRALRALPPSGQVGGAHA